MYLQLNLWRLFCEKYGMFLPPFNGNPMQPCIKRENGIRSPTKSPAK